MRVAILDDYAGVATRFADFASLPVEVTTFTEHLAGADELVRRLEPFEIVVAMRERTAFPRALLERLPRLRLIATTGMRNAAIDVAAAKERGVVVSGTQSLAHPPVELTWALILGLARHVAREDAAIRAGGWQSTVGMGLRGRTLGVVGLGRLGAEVARLGVAFGMDVVAWSEHLDEARAAAAGVRRVDKQTLFASADVVTIHLVLSARTRGLVGERELGSMKPTALLVNTARGPIVEEAALVRALEERRLGGAALDVFAEEPLPPAHPLRRLPNVLLTPHLGYVTDDNLRLHYGETVENIAAFLRGAPIRVVG
jgi:phosphoglycerate dehydrogenase-like enzyme